MMITLNTLKLIGSIHDARGQQHGSHLVLLHCRRQVAASSILDYQQNKCLDGLFYGSSCRKTNWGPFSPELHFCNFCVHSDILKWENAKTNSTQR